MQGVVLLDGGRPSLVHAEEWTQLLLLCAECWLLRLAAGRSKRRAEFGPDGEVVGKEVVSPTALQTDRPFRCLFLGLGAAIVPRTLHELRPQLTSVCVEVLEEVRRAAVACCGFAPSESCVAVVDDALRHLEREEASSVPAAEVVVVDCFTPDGLAPAVADGRLLRALSSRLKADGLCIVNTTWGVDGTAHGQTAARLAHVLREEFEHVYAVEAATCRNILLLCHHCEPLDADEWRRHLAAAGRRAGALCPDVRADAIVVQRVSDMAVLPPLQTPK